MIRALSTTHLAGVVHRDLKPENIFLADGPRGTLRPTLVDFGIATGRTGGHDKLTQTGVIMGSPAYMSPEQAKGEAVGPLSDVWSVCVVLYEAITATLPFCGENHLATLHAIVTTEPISPASLGIEVPALWPIIRHGLEKDATKRWPSADALHNALAAWLVEQGATQDIAGNSLTERGSRGNSWPAAGTLSTSGGGPRARHDGSQAVTAGEGDSQLNRLTRSPNRRKGNAGSPTHRDLSRARGGQGTHNATSPAPKSSKPPTPSFKNPFESLRTPAGARGWPPQRRSALWRTDVSPPRSLYTRW